MATEVQTQTRSDRDLPVEDQVAQLRELFADVPHERGPR